MLWPFETHFRTPLSPLHGCENQRAVMNCVFVPGSADTVGAVDAVLVHVPSFDQASQAFPFQASPLPFLIASSTPLLTAPLFPHSLTEP